MKTLVGQELTVELKNNLKVTGSLKSVDQYHNIRLDDITVSDEAKFPFLKACRNLFIRGSVVRYIHLPTTAVDTTLLEEATRREAMTHN